MPATDINKILQQLDQLNEFERQPVTEDKLQPGGYFAAVYSGEHIAATEFVIGALFVSFGAGAFDVLVGLLIGNLLAVLSWAFICAPIAVQTRLTLYWYLRQIGGPVVMIVYNVLNAVLYCILAGAMITVSASAIRIAFGIGAETTWYPRHFSYVILVLIVGAVVVTVAILGFKRLAQFSAVCSPWMVLMFAAGALAVVTVMGPVRSGRDFWEVAKSRIWSGSAPSYQSMDKQDGKIVLHFDRVGEGLISVGGGPLRGFAIAGEPEQGSKRQYLAAEGNIVGDTVIVSSPEVKDPVAVRYEWPDTPEGMLANQAVQAIRPFDTDRVQPPGRLGFWHIVAFAWICNLAMHVGLSDMALFRYARRPSYGFYSAFGMYLGHYMSWICAGIMGAAAVQMLGIPLEKIDSGDIAYTALGTAGALAVVAAGWTTANPTLYRAGLALQAVTPGWPRWLVTLAVGALTTIIACFPFVFTGLLDFVGTYGLLLMPVGAIVVVEHWIFPRIGYAQYWATRKGVPLNWPALAAWGGSLALGLICMWAGLVHLFFLAAPVWIVTAVLYIVLAGKAGARENLPELQPETPVAPPVALPTANPPASKPRLSQQWQDRIYLWSGIVAVICLCLCLLLPLFVFVASNMEQRALAGAQEALKYFLGWVTLAYFVSGTIWFNQRERRKSPLDN